MYNLRFLEKNGIYYDLLKINEQKNLKINTSVNIIKLTNQMISNSRNSHMNRKLTIREFQRDQNFWIPPCNVQIRIENE